MMKTQARNISQPSDWWEAFEREANKRGETLSEWLGNAGKAYMVKHDREALSGRPAAHRPRKTEIKADQS